MTMGLVLFKSHRIASVLVLKGFVSFYFLRVIDSRTLLQKSNPYKEIGHAAESSSLLHYSICALASCYLERDDATKYREAAMDRICTERDIKQVLGAILILLQYAVLLFLC
ncbi:hypothetical protein B0O99DRAFT_631081 [Bisporella sp. PMI_857]|nr:hypothetical protein B0O99DRAFT_631081 [Bisporella sp. PMI_857]